MGHPASTKSVGDTTARDTNTDSDTGADTGTEPDTDTPAPDEDGDGYGLDADCDDGDASIHPGAAEVVGDGVDQDCDGGDSCYVDLDGDGYAPDSIGRASTDLDCTDSGEAGPSIEFGDCDDGDSNIHPGQREVMEDGVDQDCDGADFAPYTASDGSTMIAVSAGAFTMGGRAGDGSGDYTDHRVTLTHNFYLAKTELTHGQWESNPDNAGWDYQNGASDRYACVGTLADCPVDSVSWYDVARHANWLSEQEGLDLCYLPEGTDLVAAYQSDPYACPGYRLPTEAEWEYAARAGADTVYSGSDAAGDVAWTYETAYSMGTFSHEVCWLAENAWAFCDLSGNQYEWVGDWYSATYGGYGDGAPSSDPFGPSSGTYRVLRGGYWESAASSATVAFRSFEGPSNSGDYFFAARLARSLP